MTILAAILSTPMVKGMRWMGIYGGIVTLDAVLRQQGKMQ
jgi:hypothetical protein